MDSETFSKSCVLVVGGAGFVGSNLVRRLLEFDVAAIHVVDNLLSAEKVNVPKDNRLIFHKASIADDLLLKKLDDDYDYVFHLATFHGNQNSIFDPLADHNNNQLTTLKLYERISGFKRIKKVVYSGAGCAVAMKTFDEARATVEDAPISLDMDSPYSISKIVGEFYSVYYCNRHRTPIVRARFQNVYGPWEILGAGQWRGTAATVWRNVIPTFIYKALKKESLPVENDGAGSRDFIYVEDICEGLLACALRGKPGDVYNIASGVETTILELAETINELTRNVTPLSFVPRRDWDNSGRRFGSTSKSEQMLGFRSKTDLAQGLELTINWTEENLKLIEANMAKHAGRFN
jgi:UDP-glucose 4-epimerase